MLKAFHSSLTLLVLAFLLLTLPLVSCGEEEEGVIREPGPGEFYSEQDDSDSASSPTGRIAGAPSSTVRLVFIHHSVGEDWLSDEGGGLGLALMSNNYFVSDTNYGWGPGDEDSGIDNIGDHTDIGDWCTWFDGANSAAILEALYSEDGQNSGYSRLASDPGGENQIVMFKSCYPNSGLEGNPDDEATEGDNPLRGEDCGSENHTVANAKGIYNQLLDYFATRPDKLFVVITAPPIASSDTDSQQAANARAFNTWLVEEWLAGYPHDNVAVFDLFNVLTSNAGDPDTNDLGSGEGNHHRYQDGSLQYVTDQAGDYSAYAYAGDSHPTAAGARKASAEFLSVLNAAYQEWQGD